MHGCEIHDLSNPPQPPLQTMATSSQSSRRQFTAGSNGIHHSCIAADSKEKDRGRFERLRLAAAKPAELQWRLPDRIEFRRADKTPSCERHLYQEEDGSFRDDPGCWERGLLAEELANEDVVGWLRNLDRTPWSMEIPDQSAGAKRPICPNLVVVRRGESG